MSVRPVGIGTQQRGQSFQALIAVLYSLVLSRCKLVLALSISVMTCPTAAVGGTTADGGPSAAAVADGPGPCGQWGRILGESSGSGPTGGGTIDLKGRLSQLQVTGPDFEWGALFVELQAQGVAVVVTDDVKVYAPAPQARNLKQQQCMVHMQRMVHRPGAARTQPCATNSRPNSPSSNCCWWSCWPGWNSRLEGRFGRLKP